MSELIGRLRHLVSLNEEKNGGPYEGLAAEQCVIAMREAAEDLGVKDALIRELVAALADRDAEIEHLKLEMDGVDNAKEEIGRLLGLTEEFRWKRISAAIHEQKRLIRELVAALKPFAEEEPEHEEISEDNELVAPRWLDATYGQYRAARAVLAKAKAVGFEP